MTKPTNMKKYLLFFTVVISCSARAQQTRSVSEESPLAVDGIEYGYAIKNVSTREVNNKDFSRYEVTLFATNKSECNRVVLFGQNHDEAEDDKKLLAHYDCINATGARLTSKSGEINAKPMFVTARVNTRDKQGKEIQENQKV